MGTGDHGGIPAFFHPAVAEWFQATFARPTRAQALGWPAIARGESTLLVAPTGTGKTLAAFLWAIERVMFVPPPPATRRCRVLYVSPLKALAVDVERNLRVPLDGIARAAAARGEAVATPAVAIRTGDTPRDARARFLREPADILITTPESLFLLLTSRAREVMRSVETVIVDEIHALVSTKRGAHLALSLERLEWLAGRPLQRIGLSATVRPFEEVAAFLGGTLTVPPTSGVRPTQARRPPTRSDGRAERAAAGASGPAPAAQARPADERPSQHRPVTVIDARAPKTISLSIEMPARENRWPAADPQAAPAPASGPPSAWTGIHPRLLDLVRQHRSTLVFVNNRRLAERLAASLNDLAGEPIARAHHGSLAREQRTGIEEALKLGRLRALVATSSLELGIDMGAIDLVVQVEAPPSVTSGLQRIGRSGHQAGATSRGVVFPKFNGDLLACAAVARGMRDGRVEASRYPRSPLDVLAQQVVAMAATDDWDVDELFAVVRRAAPFADLGRRSFENVLDMLSGRYPSDDFAELRPRLTWNRSAGRLSGREGAARVAIANAGTIPDRGLFGVFLAGAPRGTGRVGELDEEMVFESRVGETFVLGASTWRIEEITHDRVLVSPAPGRPGKMPFWRGDLAGRPGELGMAIGRLVRELRGMPPAAVVDWLVREYVLTEEAAGQLQAYLEAQAVSSGVVPDDRTVVVERCRDELGDWRVCVLSPFGGRVHAPWAMAATARVRELRGLDVETMWTDEGFVARFPDTDEPPDPAWLVPPASDLERLLTDQLGATSLFAGRFREVAARSLLLPRRRAGRRAPLWQQRKRASDLLAVAARFGSFPAVLETYRECLQDLLDLPTLAGLLGRIERRSARVVTVDSRTPSPFAASLLFTYTASYLYDGDAPLPERRAQALAIDQDQLHELLGEAELRELLDPDVIEQTERELQQFDARRRALTADTVHDLLLRGGDLSRAELAARGDPAGLDEVIGRLLADRRIVEATIGHDSRFVAAEDAARYRDAVGATLRANLPDTLLSSVADPLGDLVRRYARTHGPFHAEDVAGRLGIPVAAVGARLADLARTGWLVRGGFLPGGYGREWCQADVLKQIRRRTLARLRREVEPVGEAAFARFLASWHHVSQPRRGVEALLGVIEQLQGAPLVASDLEREILPCRLDDYRPTDLDALMAHGEVTWVGLDPIGERDGRIAIFLADHLHRLAAPAAPGVCSDPRQAAIVDWLAQHGASFFGALHDASGRGFPAETVRALWELVWAGRITNDTLMPLRSYVARTQHPGRYRDAARPRGRRLVPLTAEGRWSLVPRTTASASAQESVTEWAAATASQLLTRHGLVTRETLSAEVASGSAHAIAEVLRAMEASGRIRRGYFVSGLTAFQFIQPLALDLLRSFRDPAAQPATVRLAATDPANPYGAVIGWNRTGAAPWSGGTAPDGPHSAGRTPARTSGASVVLVDGALAAYLARGERQLRTFLPEAEPDRGRIAGEVARALAGRATATGQGMLLNEIDGAPAAGHPFAADLERAGFIRRGGGLMAVARKDPDSVG